MLARDTFYLMTQVDKHRSIFLDTQRITKTEHLYQLVLLNEKYLRYYTYISMLGLSNKEGKKRHYLRRKYLRGNIGCLRLAGAQS